MIARIALIVAVLWLAWLATTLAHEAGHVAGAIATGGTVRRVVWHPTVLSRTDVEPNPSPRVERWAGPIAGAVVPALIASIASASRWRFAYAAWAVAGFGLIANGAYLGTATVRAVGDARALIAHGESPVTMSIVGAAAIVAGFGIWHRVSPRFGFGKAPAPARASHAIACVAAAAVVTLLGLLFGDRGT